GMGTLNVKQLFGLINLQLRRLAQGTASLPESMLRDALFFIAAAREPTPEARQLRAAFALEGMLPADVEARRYGQVDQDALQGARAALAQARASWSRLAQADLDPALGTDFDASLQEVAAHVETLKQPALASLLRECAAVARLAVASGRSAALENEIGMALLFAETGLEQVRRLPDDFAGNAETIAARLHALLAGEAPPPAAAGELSRQIEQGQTVAALAEDMKTGLRQVEKLLNDYYADGARQACLDGVAPLLRQLQQQLASLEQEDAGAAVQQVEAAVLQLPAIAAQADQAEALDEIAQNVSALGFFIDMLGRNAQAASGRFHFDAAAGTFRALPFEKVAAAGAVPVPLLDQALAPAAPAGMDAAPAVSDVDAEMLDIFIAEAREVLAFVDTTLALPREQTASGDHLAMLRRSFHTLKGSSRMIGLAQFAEAAGAIERVMNTWLAEARPVSDDLFTLLNYGWYQLSEWVAELEGGAGRGREAGMLLMAAERVREGGPFELRKPRPASAAPVAGNGNVIGLPLATAPVAHEAPDDHLKHVGELRISLPLYNIYLAETDELLRVLTRDFGEWRHEQRAVSAEALQAVHTLAGTSGTVGFQSLRDLAHALETVIETVVPPLAGLRAEQHDVLEQATQRIGHMLQAFALGDLAPTQPDMIEALNTLWRALTAPPGESQEERLDALFAAAYASIVGAPAQPAEPLADAPADALAEIPVPQLETLFEATYASIVADALQPQAAEASVPAPVHDSGASDDLFDAGFEHAPPLEHAAPEAPA
ncbi:MAG: Hpt domain-containing protein, partial [Janthinobacterium sp.]